MFLLRIQLGINCAKGIRSFEGPNFHYVTVAANQSLIERYAITVSVIQRNIRTVCLSMGRLQYVHVAIAVYISASEVSGVRSTLDNRDTVPLALQILSYFVHGHVVCVGAWLTSNVLLVA